MAFSYLDEENIFELYDLAKEHTEKLTEPFAEFSRIARNKPHPKIPKRFPKTTDGTASSIISKAPRRVIQQLPSGVIESEDEYSIWPILADFTYRTEILPLANAEYDLIQKCWVTVENGQTFGSQSVYTPMIDHDGKITPDYLTPYWGDIFVQPGKKSGYDCNYVFMRTWWQEGDVEKLMADEESRKKNAKNAQVAYESHWDLAALKEILDAIVDKDETSKTPAEEELGLDASGIEIVTGFQVGVGATFFTFNPDKKKILRRKPNKDLRGKIPIDWYYFDIDGSNPLGRSLLDLIGPLQNLIDSDMQAYQYNRALALQPPMNAYGNINIKTLSTAPNAVNKITDANAKLEPMTIDTSAIRDYPSLYGLQKSQMLNLVSSPDTSISAEVGNPGFGKTPTAIKTQNAQVSVDDNAMRKGFEALWENWSETSINILFGERTGEHTIQLDKETANKIRELEVEGRELEDYELTDDNKITIDFDQITSPLHFRVDASTSKVNTESAQLEALQILVQSLDASESLNSVVPVDRKLKLWNAIVANTAIEDSENLKVTDEELEQMQKDMADEEQLAIAAEEAAAQEQSRELPLEAEVVDMPPEDEFEPELDPEDAAITNELRAIGIPEDLIAEVPAMIDKGYSDDEIMASIQGVLEKEDQDA